jgi:isopentenyl diphosphate isomerase/L-lactate dehydrogenase-like FMN-dependent dehydrogenase
MSTADLPFTLADFEARAAEKVDAGPLNFYAGAAGDEVTLADNLAAWRRWAIRPRVMVDVSEIDRTTTLLGRERAHPIVVAPVAFQGWAHPDAEPATARAAAATGTTFCLSTMANTSIGDVAAAAPDATRWFQLYVFRDRGVSRDLVAQAVEAGYEALVVTVDVPVIGLRERDVKTGFASALSTPIPSALAAGRSEPMSLLDLLSLMDPTLTWKDIEAFASESGLPVVVKGVLAGEDGRLAAESGAAAVVVSNHGGRQLDTVLAGVDALPEVVESVGGAIDVLVDGGIRRGTDIFKALALGAQAVMVGRPMLWGLACGGEDGARRVLDILLAGFDNTLALAGVPRARDVTRESLVRADWR